jgi:hypothetical protein
VRASIARGVCLVRLGQPAAALDTLAPVVTQRDETLSRIAAAWAARASLATLRFDSAAALARTARSDALDAELAGAALAAGRSALAARILRQRAGDWRSLSVMHVPLRTLAKSDRPAADSIVQITQDGRASRLERARLSVAAASWSELAGDAAAARRHYDRALEITADTALVTDVVTRLVMLDVRAAATLADAHALVERARRRAAATAELSRVDTALRLAARLAKADDSTGASLFLAGEVARDAVGAPSLARSLFLGVARDRPRSSLAPKALLAAASLTSDSASTWRKRVLSQYTDSPYAHMLDGRPVAAPALEADERLLRETWSRATATPDSATVAAQRPQP